ncbi:MAG: hypothetical protein AB7N76_27110 [Planctomycetota bacterium]
MAALIPPALELRAGYALAAEARAHWVNVRPSATRVFAVEPLERAPTGEVDWRYALDLRSELSQPLDALTWALRAAGVEAFRLSH